MYKYAVVKIGDDGKIVETIKEGYGLMDIQHGSLDGLIYPSVFVSKEDLLSILEDQIEDNEKDESRIEKRIDEMWKNIEAIPEHEMIHLASKLQDQLVEYGGYWDFLEEWLKDHGYTIDEDEK